MQRRNFLRLSALGAIGLSVGAWFWRKPATKYVMTYNMHYQGILVYELPLDDYLVKHEETPVVSLPDALYECCKVPCDRLQKLSIYDDKTYPSPSPDRNSMRVGSRYGCLIIPVTSESRGLVRQMNALIGPEEAHRQAMIRKKVFEFNPA